MKKFGFLVIILSATPLYAGNSHEHFQLLPSAKNFSTVAPQIFQLDHNSQKLASLFSNSTILKALLEESNFTNTQIESVLKDEAFQTLTLADLCSKLGGDPKANLEKLLAIQNIRVSDKALAKRTFVAIENLRRSLVLLLDAKTVVSIFENYFKDEPITDRDEIEITVSSVYFGKDQLDKLRKIKEIGRIYGSHIEYLYSVRRPQLENLDFRFLENELDRLLDEGLIMGIDLTGSMYEATEKKNLDYDAALQQLFDISSRKHLLLKLHSFEGDNSGPFYDALFRVFSGYNKSLRLRIGHINKMTPYWLSFLNSNPPVQVSLDAVIETNIYLHENSSIENIYETIEEARRLSLPVFMGSDGRGMIEGSSYSEQKNALELFSCSRLLNFKKPSPRSDRRAREKQIR